MTIDFPTALIATVFAAQIVVCSFISAWRFAKSARLLKEKYPPAEYPKLYPVAPEKMHRQHNLRMAIRLAIGAAAVVVLVTCLARGIGAGQLANYMIWVAMAQILPALLFIPQQLGIARALRAMPAPAVRSAELRPWQVTDFVSPTWIALGLVMSAVSLGCVAYFHFYNPARNAMPLHALSFAITAWLLGRMVYVLARPVVIARPDPYMSSDDVFRARQQRLRLLFRGGFVMSAYFAFMQFYGAGQLRFEFYYVSAGASILIQLLSLHMTRMLLSAITERDLSPYRAAPTRE